MSTLERKAAWAGLIKSFLTHLSVERGSPKNTTEAYRGDIECLGSHLAWIELPYVTKPLLSAHMAHLGNRGLSAATCKRHRAAIQQFFRFHNLTTADSIDPVKQERSLPKPIASGIIASMIENEPILRNKAILECLYGAGLRVTELLMLCVEDIQPGWTLLVRGKGGKERFVPLGEPGQIALRKWIAASQPVKRVPLFAMCRMQVWRVVRLAAARVGVVCAHPHMLRHSFASHLLQGGADIKVIQQLMGHEFVDTTAGYAELDTRHKMDTIRKFHPRERVAQ